MKTFNECCQEVAEKYGYEIHFGVLFKNGVIKHNDEKSIMQKAWVFFP